MRFCLIIYAIAISLQCPLTSGQFNGRRSCPCDQGQGVWGSWNGAPQCSGKCNLAFYDGSFTCIFSFPNGTRLNDPINCPRSIPTNSCAAELCLGEWSTWETVGECSNDCGSGVHSQRRACYKKDSSTRRRILTISCLGEETREQIRSNPCERRINCNNATTLKATLATTTIQRAEETTDATAAVTSQSTLLQAITNEPNQGAGSSPEIVIHRTTSGFNTVALASALGAAAIICVIIVFVSAVVVFRTHSSAKHQVVSYSTNLTEPTAITTVSVRSKNKSEDQQVLPTSFYEFDNQEDGVPNQVNNGSQTDRNESVSGSPEAVYFTVDDQNK